MRSITRLLMRIRLSIKESPLSSLFLVLSLCVGFFCLNAYFVSAKSEYQIEISASWGGALTVVPLQDDILQVDLYNELKNQYGGKVENVLYFSKVEENHYLIGWVGLNEPGRWFPHAAGRFFTEQELASASGMIYLDSETYKRTRNNRYESDGFSYTVIGSGLILNYNLTTFIAADSKQSIFPTGANLDVNAVHPKVEVLPYQTYLERNHPTELLVIYFNGFSRSELEKITKDLMKKYPGTDITLPREDTDKFYTDAIVKYVKIGAELSLLVWASFAAGLLFWLEENRELIRVYRICGSPMQKNRLWLLTELFLLFVLGEGLSLLLILLLNPLLQLLDAGSFPPLWFPLFSMLLSYLLVVLLSFRRLRGTKDIQRKDR